MKNNKILWILILIIGLLPFLFVFGIGIHAAINGMTCLDDCVRIIGFKAFIGMSALYSLVFWPTYIVGLVLIIISIIQIRKNG